MRAAFSVRAKSVWTFMTTAAETFTLKHPQLKLKGGNMLTVNGSPAVNRHMQRPSTHVATTLYDLIEAVSEQVPSDEEYLLTPAVLKLLKDCRAGFMNNRAE
jgi:hypothetical protein